MIACSEPPSAWGIMKPPISLYYAWRNIPSAYNKDTVSKSKQMSCKNHLQLYFCNDQRFLYKEGTVLVPQKVSDLNQSQNRSCTTLAKQPSLGTTLTKKTCRLNPSSRSHTQKRVSVLSLWANTAALQAANGNTRVFQIQRSPVQSP